MPLEKYLEEKKKAKAILSQKRRVASTECQRVKVDRPWLVGGNNERELPAPEDGAFILGTTATTAAGEVPISVRTNDCERIRINGLVPESEQYSQERTGRVYIRNGAIETPTVGVNQRTVPLSRSGGDPIDVQFQDLYLEVPSNSYIVTFQESDITTNPQDPTLVDGAVNINNIFLGEAPSSTVYPSTYSLYPNNLTPSIAPNDPDVFTDFEYTLTINNASSELMLVNFTPGPCRDPNFPKKVTETLVSWNVDPYEIPAGGFMIAKFRVNRSDVRFGNDCRAEVQIGNTTHIMISHLVYDCPRQF